jgi:membrane associated rhomboid family serine protease
VELVDNDPLDVTAGPPSGDQCVAVRPDYHKIPALSVLTAMFLHGGLLHLVGNMLFLFVFGNNVEDRLGRVRYLLFYLACGYLATYGFALADPTSEQTLVGRRAPSPGCSAPTWSCSPGPGDQPGAVPVLHPGLAPGLGRARLLVRPAVALLPGRRHAEGAGVAYLAHVVGFAAGRGPDHPLRRLRARRPPPPPSGYYYQQR